MPHSLKARIVCSTALALLSTGVAAPVLAADAAAPTALGEVIVTATKRETDVQKVPISITVLSGGAIEKTGAVSLKDLQFAIPDFNFGGESTVRRPDIALRGIQSATRVPGYEGSIGFFVDGVYEPFPDQWDNPVLDVDRLEVLYGPQDTLFGKNTIAGAISITTKKPTGTFGGDASAEYGNHSYYSFRGDVNVPLVKDVLFARLSGFTSERGGYITNLYDGSKLENMNEQGARFQLRFDPTPHFEANFSTSVFLENVRELQNDVLGGPDSTSSPWQVDINTTPKTSRYLYDANLTLDYTFDSGAKLTSITAWQQTRAWYRTDEDGNPVDAWVTNLIDHNHDIQQELRFTSARGKLFDFVAGVYFLDTYWLSGGGIGTLPSDPVNQPGGTTTALLPDGLPDYSKGTDVEAQTYAVYFDDNMHLTDKLTLTGGARMTHDDKYLHFGGQQNYGDGFLNFFAPGGIEAVKPLYDANLSETAFTGSGAVDYQLTPRVLLYATIASGYKGGGWATDFGQPFPPQQFKPENMLDYEVGEKAQFWDDRVRLNADIFYMDYTNKQEEIYLGPISGFVISNAAAATIAGIEVNSTVLLSDHWRLDGGLSWIDPYYNSFPSCQSPSGAPANCTGKQLEFATRLNATVSADYTTTIPTLGALDVSANATYRDKMYFDTVNEAAESVPGVTLVNARVSLKLKDSRTEIYAFAKNILDKTYLISRFASTEGIVAAGQYEVLYGEPRMYGLGLKYHF
jgi:iron complex outermembrane receptor protein